MKTVLKSVAAASLAACVLGLVPGAASAMPLGFEPAIVTGADAPLRAENVRWVCGPWRCRWVPNYYGFAPAPYWRPRPYWGPRRGWRRW